MADASPSVRRWPSPENSVTHPLWKVSPADPGQRDLPEQAKQAAQLLGAAVPAARRPPPAFGAAVAPPVTPGATPAGGPGAVPPGRSEGGVRSPSLMGLGSPRPPGTFVSRRREARRELAVNDADERMSWSSFDSLDVRVDDQVGGREKGSVCEKPGQGRYGPSHLEAS